MLHAFGIEAPRVRSSTDRAYRDVGHGDVVEASRAKCHCGGDVCFAARFRKMTLCWVCYRLHVSAVGQLEHERVANRWAELEEPK